MISVSKRNEFWVLYVSLDSEMSFLIPPGSIAYGFEKYGYITHRASPFTIKAKGQAGIMPSPSQCAATTYSFVNEWNVSH